MEKGALLAKMDIENAYKQIPINPSDFKFLGFMTNNQSSMTKHFLLASAIHAISLKEYSTSVDPNCKNQDNVHMLDDFLFIGSPNSHEYHSSWLAFYILAKNIGLPIKSEKTVTTRILL